MSQESNPVTHNGYLYSAETLMRRLDKVRDRMRELDLDSLLVSHPDNRRYVSGFAGEDAPPLDTAGFLIVGLNDLCLVTDGRYDIQAARELPREVGASVVVRKGKMATTVAEQVSQRGFKRLGFDTAHLIHMWWRQIDKSLPDTDLVPTLRLI